VSETRTARRKALVLATALILTASCAAVALGGSVAGADPDLASVSLGLAPITTGLATPVALAWRSGDNRIYVAEQGGTVRIIDPTTGAVVSTALTVTDTVASGERGLLGLTFSPDGTKLYVDYTDGVGTIHIVEYTMAGDIAVVASARELLAIAHPRTNHNGGEVIFGPDGYLYIGTGDGGGGGDPDLNGQNVNVLLGKILRIDPAPSDSLPYTIPPDNPFAGLPNHRAEIWMYGLRNPWRFSFDRVTGDVWIADVGQGLYEEVDYSAAGTSAGANWGWNLREGFHSYAGAQPPDGRDPLLEKAHADGYCAVIGGFVYRGSAIANLNGAYVFGDLCQPHLSAAVQTGGVLAQQVDFGVGAPQISTFGEDHNGELYVANLNGTVYRLVGTPPPTVSVGDVAMLEGDSGTRLMKFPVTLSSPSSSAVTVHYSVDGVDATGGSKRAAGVDFKNSSGTITFNVNASGTTPISRAVAVSVYGDAGIEPNETLRVTLSLPTGGYGLLRSSGTGTILNDDDGSAPAATLGIGDGAIVQQAGGSEMLQLPVTLSLPVGGTVSVGYAVTPGSATYSSKAAGGGEFGGKLTGTVTFASNQTLRQISLPIWPDLISDADHQLTITLSALSGSGVTLTRATGTGTILDP
jgi:glucose/arabinose dehydrogenase